MATVPINRTSKLDLEKPLPHNLDAERYILGAILIDNTSLKIAADHLKAEDFFLDQNRRIFRQMLVLADAVQPIDLITLNEELNRHKQLDAAGGIGYISSLGDGIPKIGNVEHYAKLIKEKSRQRAILHKTHEIQQRILNGSVSYEDACTDFTLFTKETTNGNHAKLIAVDAKELATMDVAPVNFVIEPILPVKGIGMIYAWRGVGKTFFTMEVAFDVATGEKCFVWPVPEPRRVRYVDGEMDVETLQQRLREIWQGHPAVHLEPEFLKFITPDLQKHYLPKINTRDSQAAIEEHLQYGDLLILDNLSALCPSSQEDETGDWIMVQEWLLHLRRSGITVLFMHHAGKGGAQRGFSGKEDLINVTINLRRGEGYQMEDQLRAEVHLEKVRGKAAVGTLVQPFEITLTTDDGKACWLQRPLRELVEKRAFQMFSAGMKPNDVAQDLRLNRYQVYRLRKKFDGGYQVGADDSPAD